MIKIKRGINNLFIYSIVTKLILVLFSLINTVLINRYLGTYLRGEYAFIMNVTNILQLVFSLGIGYSFSYFKKKRYTKIVTFFSFLIYIQFFFYSLLFFLFGWFVGNEHVRYIVLLSIVLTLDIQMLFITMIEDIRKRNNIVMIISIIYTLALFVIYVFSRKNLNFVLNITLCRYFLECFVLSYVFKMYKIDIDLLKNNMSLRLLKQIFSVGLPVMIMTLLITFNYNIDIILMKSYLSNSEIGLYGVGVTLANMLWIIPDAFKEVLFGKSTKGDSSSEVITSLFVNIFICIIIIIGFVFLGKSFIKILYGVEYIDSYKVAVILFIGTIPMLFFKLIHPIYISNGKQNLVTKILLVSVILNIILNLLIMPEFGIVGSAISSVISYAICGSMFAERFKRNYQFNYFAVFMKEFIKAKKVIWSLIQKSQ